VDVAEDVCGPGAYGQLQRISARVARDHGLKRSRIVPDNPLSGRTVYLGSRTSTVFVRIYEKGKQVIAGVSSGAATVDAQQLGVDLQGHPLDTWARCEVEVKPKAHARQELVRLAPEQFWGCASWTADLYKDLSGSDVERINVGSVWQADDLTRTVRSMLNQYGRTLERLHADLGSWECVGLQLGDELAQLRSPSARGHGAE
jgi:DNA relaxase NicK